MPPNGTSNARFGGSGIDAIAGRHELVLSTGWPPDAIAPGPMRYLMGCQFGRGVSRGGVDQRLLTSAKGKSEQWLAVSVPNGRTP